MEQNLHSFELQRLNMDGVMAITARLAQVLAEEADLLADMKVKDIVPLQKEKLTLARALDLQIQRVQKNPELLDEITEEEREDLRDLAGVFDEIKAENFRRLLSAKEVNQRVVEAIMEAVNAQNRKPTYTEEGVNDRQFDAISVTLDKKI